MNPSSDILYYIDIYKKFLKIIIVVMFISMFITAVFLFFQPNSYVSTVTILSADIGQSQAASMGSLGKFFGISGMSTDSFSDIIMSLVDSKRMENDIKVQFNLDKNPDFKYSVITNKITGGIAIDVKGTDPDLTGGIANFIVQNFDKINIELSITSSRPMVKVLDVAVRGKKQSKQMPKNMAVSGMFVFLVMSLYIYISDYIKNIKTS